MESAGDWFLADKEFINMVAPEGRGMKIGLLNGKGKYLTMEYYRNSVSASGTKLDRKQIWEVCLRAEQGNQALVELKGSGGLFLLVDPDGLLRCGYPESDHHSHFLLNIYPDGKWAFKSLATNLFLEWNGDEVVCVSESMRNEHLWIPHLAIHSHVVLYNMRKNCYARADPLEGRILVDAIAPYDKNCGFILTFDSEKYKLETADHGYLAEGQELVKTSSLESAMTVHLRPGNQLAFKNVQGNYFYPQGRTGVLAPGPNPIGKEEWFIVERFPTWVTLRSKSKKYMSIACEVEVCANFKEASPLAIFQYEVDRETQRARLKASNKKYLAQRGQQSLLANGDREEKAATTFEVKWQTGNVTLRANNGCYLAVKPIGLVTASAVKPGPNEEFLLRVANRPFLILRGRYGYIGSSQLFEVLQCNSIEHECIEILPCTHGFYHFKGANGMFWSMSNQMTFRVDGDSPLNFHLEIYGTNVLAVLAPNGCYLRGEQSGLLVADAKRLEKDCLWEF